MPDDDFTFVKSKRRGKTNLNTATQHGDLHDSGSCSVDEGTVLRRIETAKQDILESDFYSCVLSSLRQGLQLLGDREVQDILCYGLGNFAECMVARYQLALLLSLKGYYKAHVLIHDPVFYETEVNVLRKLDCEVILENEEGKREVKPSTTTLVYLPHCPKQLTNNFLWKNWGPDLNNCVIFCNSFTKTIESHPKRNLNSESGYILNLYPYTEELGIINSFKYRDIFNDIALHVFPEKKLKLAAAEFWKNFCEEPKYNTEDTEFITNKIISALEISH